MRNPIYTLFRRLRSPLIVLILVYAVSIIGFVLIPGIDDKGQHWDMSFFHAFYFVSFMGTTIGFGEIPYAFTDAQRFWALVTMYATVISWLYGIGVMLSVFQDPLFLNQLKKNTLRRRIKNIREPFYIICGYGDTGSQLSRLLSKEGILSVIVDPDAERINELEDEDFLVRPLSLCADASQSEVLQMAGIEHTWCKGIITIANDDNVNLTVAIVAQILNPDLRLIARAETPEAESNILSFGANEVINPFETFSSRLALAFKSPSLYCLYDWMTGESGTLMKEPPCLADEGLWIICGFGRFGRSLYDHLDDEGVRLKIIEADRSQRDIPSGSIIGRATEAPTLKKAGIEEAVGIIAGSDNDANNLSIILTASELNPDIYRVIRQSSDKNEHLFENSHHEMLMHRGSIISNTIFAFIRTPMLGDFLRIVSRFNKDRANELVSKLIAVVEDDEPKLWEFSVTSEQSPALYEMIQKQKVLVGDIFQGITQYGSNQRDKPLSALPLFLKRGKSNVLLPENDRPIRAGDRILMCGTRQAQHQMNRVLTNIQILKNVLYGKEVSNSLFWKWLNNRKAVRNS
ncbi:MAG: NAD-binding protein [Cocleimonas sp.]